MVKVVAEGVSLVSLTGTKPEKKPPAARGWQGSANDDCVTVWFCGVLAGRSGGGDDGRWTDLGEEIELDQRAHFSNDIAWRIGEAIGPDRNLERRGGRSDSSWGCSLNCSHANGNQANE